MSASESRSSSAARALPTGLVTFAFTDIEGSTRRWERDEAAMREAVRRHDALVREAILAADGAIFKTIGDAFCAAFSYPTDAIEAMLAVQRALARADFDSVDGLRVRAAIHTGIADERDGDYFGTVVNRVARLLAVAHGGQIVLSGATAELVRTTLPATVTLGDLGDHRLKDLASSERVHQVLAPGLQATFPALRSLDVREHNLPQARTSFVGREAEIATIGTLLHEHRLVTLVGTGGIGKTRTSLQVAADVLDAATDGVWFVEFAPLASGEYVVGTIAQAANISLASGDQLASLVRALASKRALIVFDNCEHVVDAAARTASALLAGCPGLRILATSRQALGIAGESAYRLATLPVAPNDPTAPLRASDALRNAAIALFVERAQSADHRFALTDENVATVNDICRRLDGIPLAIELAASRVRILTPLQVHGRLNERFRVLTGGSRDVLPRQQTLRALIDWSYDLLDERERAMFRRLSAFVDGFTLDGGVFVGGGGDLDALDAFDVLASLVDKSLVSVEGEGDSRRYRLLQSTQAYAREKLEAAGARDATAVLHLGHLHERFRAAHDVYVATGRQSHATDLLAAELDDVRAALAFALSGPHVGRGAQLLAWSERGWRALDLAPEGFARAESFLAALGADAEPALEAQLLSAISTFAQNSGRKTRAYDTAIAALDRARTSGDSIVLGFALAHVAYVNAVSERLDLAVGALDELDASGVITAAIESKALEARAAVYELQGKVLEAVRLISRKRDIEIANGNAFGAAYSTLNLAELEHLRGRSREAADLVRGALADERFEMRRGMHVMHMTMNLAGYLLALDDPREALDVARAAIRQAERRDPSSPFVVIALEHAALALALLGAFETAALLEGYVARATVALGFTREHTEYVTHARLDAILAERLSADIRVTAVTRGAALPASEACHLAFSDETP